MHIDTAARGGRRSLDAGINIVPYIDMLMTLMIFLMVTAVWTHTRSLDVEGGGGGGEPCTGACAEPVHVHVTADVFVVESSPTHDVATAVQLARHWADERSSERLGEHARADTAADVVGAPVDVEVDDGVRLDRVAAFLDAAKGAGLTTPSLRGVAR